MEWLLSLLPPPLYYAAVVSFLLSCLYLFGWDAWCLLDRLVERRLQLIPVRDEAATVAAASTKEDAIQLRTGLAPLARALSTVSNSGLPDEEGGGNFAYLGKLGKWKPGQVEYESGIESVVLRKQPAIKRAQPRIVSLESLQRISLDALDIGDNSFVIVTLHTDATQVSLRTGASDAVQWIQGLLEQLLHVRPKLVSTPRPLVTEESITEKLKLVCEADAPSFSIDLLALLLKEYNVVAKRADLKNHLQRTTGKVKLETYRETVDAAKDIMGQLDNPEIFQRYATAHSNGNLVTVTDFHRFVTESQGLKEHSLPETLRLLRSLATSDTDLLDLGLLTRRVFRTALLSKLYTMPLKFEHLELRQPLNLPLTDYFISTSHNTYLMEDQIKGRSDCLAYEIALKKNCRCVELDIHNGPNNDPIITHGGTMTTKIRFEDVIKTIRRFAFVASEYPLILSFENHCGIEQQDKMAQILTTHLKEYLYFDEASDHMERLPCPEDLKRKIIIKNKKIHPHPIGGFSAFSGVGPMADAEAEDESDDESDNEVQQLATGGRHSFTELSTMSTPPATSMTSPSTIDDDSRTSSEVQSSSPMDSTHSLTRRYSSEKTGRDAAAGKKRKKLKVSQALSDLVSICRPVKFKGQKYARENYRPVEMSSLGESKLDKRQWLKKDGEDANKMVLHSQYQLVRIYPSGLRTNSSNYNPISAWRFGCQLAALNYQTRCENMEINDGLFQLNGACGYVPKPAILSEPGTKFNPLSPPSSDLARCLRLEIVSGVCLRHPSGKERETAEEKGLSPYVKVALFGVPGDERKDQTKKADQGFSPRWNYRCFEDNKMVKVPELAHLRLEVKDKISGKVIGQFTAPLTAFSQGYRRIFLKDSKDVPTSSELWIKFELHEP